jgi:hypothetical protein
MLDIKCLTAGASWEIASLFKKSPEMGSRRKLQSNFSAFLTMDDTSNTMKAQFASLLSEARDMYGAGLGMPALDEFRHIQSIKDLETAVEEQNMGFKAFRDKRQSLFHAIDVALKPIELANSVVSGVSSIAFAPSSTIFSAVMFLIKGAKGVSACYDNITELLSELKVCWSDWRPDYGGLLIRNARNSQPGCRLTRNMRCLHRFGIRSFRSS